MQAETDVP